ncbi:MULTISPECIES: cell wall-binding repeat-containing protein [unclassified Clostridium]|uniref:cell wall-binding repeat-containing protein n=1 Tax=unclassified Clostridium TaxID=2614128 RepID=UPI0025BDA795|nr:MULTISPECIES: cell wall-binding repeat-containing protein [unclassified Clostridium]
MFKGKRLAMIIALSLILCSKKVYGRSFEKLENMDRYELSITVAKELWDNAYKGEKTAVLALEKDENLVDLLSISTLAYKKKAPIILINNGEKIEDELIEKLKIKGVNKVYLPSGEGILKEELAFQLKSHGIDVMRLGGMNRIETSINISKELGEYKSVAVIGYNGLPDSISLGQIAVREETAILVSDNNGNIKENFYYDNKNNYVVGGEKLVSSESENKLKAKRIYGENRYETNLKVVEHFKDKLSFNKIYISNGQDNQLAQALIIGQLATVDKAPLILLDKDNEAKAEKLFKNSINKYTEINFFNYENKNLFKDILNKHNSFADRKEVNNKDGQDIGPVKDDEKSIDNKNEEKDKEIEKDKLEKLPYKGYKKINDNEINIEFDSEIKINNKEKIEVITKNNKEIKELAIEKENLLISLQEQGDFSGIRIKDEAIASKDGAKVYKGVDVILEDDNTPEENLIAPKMLNYKVHDGEIALEFDREVEIDKNISEEICIDGEDIIIQQVKVEGKIVTINSKGEVNSLTIPKGLIRCGNLASEEIKICIENKYIRNPSITVVDKTIKLSFSEDIELNTKDSFWKYISLTFKEKEASNDIIVDIVKNQLVVIVKTGGIVEKINIKEGFIKGKNSNKINNNIEENVKVIIPYNEVKIRNKEEFEKAINSKVTQKIHVENDIEGLGEIILDRPMIISGNRNNPKIELENLIITNKSVVLNQITVKGTNNEKPTVSINNVEMTKNEGIMFNTIKIESSGTALEINNSIIRLKHVNLEYEEIGLIINNSDVRFLRYSDGNYFLTKNTLENNRNPAIMINRDKRFNNYILFLAEKTIHEGINNNPVIIIHASSTMDILNGNIDSYTELIKENNFDEKREYKIHLVN